MHSSGGRGLDRPRAVKHPSENTSRIRRPTARHELPEPQPKEVCAHMMNPQRRAYTYDVRCNCLAPEPTTPVSGVAVRAGQCRCEPLHSAIPRLFLKLFWIVAPEGAAGVEAGSHRGDVRSASALRCRRFRSALRHTMSPRGLELGGVARSWKGGDTGGSQIGPVARPHSLVVRRADLFVDPTSIHADARRGRKHQFRQGRFGKSNRSSPNQDPMADASEIFPADRVP